MGLFSMNKAERMGVITLLAVLIVLAGVNIALRSCGKDTVAEDVTNMPEYKEFVKEINESDSLIEQKEKRKPRKKARAKTEKSYDGFGELPVIKNE